MTTPEGPKQFTCYVSEGGEMLHQIVGVDGQEPQLFMMQCSPLEEEEPEEDEAENDAPEDRRNRFSVPTTPVESPPVGSFEHLSDWWNDLHDEAVPKYELQLPPGLERQPDPGTSPSQTTKEYEKLTELNEMVQRNLTREADEPDPAARPSR